MNAVFFVLVAIMGSETEGVKVRAIRRRLIEYPYEPPRQIIPVPRQTEYAQTVPINEDPRRVTYPDRNSNRYMYGPTYGGNVNQNRRVISNVPNILWMKAPGPDLIQFGEVKPGPNEYNLDQSSREGIERINYSVDQTDTNSGYKEISLNSFKQRFETENQINNSVGENKLNITDGNRNGTVVLSDTNKADSGSVTGGIEISTDENLVDKVSGNDKQNNNQVSLLSIQSTAPGREDDVNTVNQSKLNVENVRMKPIRYVANKPYLLPPLSRRFYPVDEIKTDLENETSQLNMENVNTTKEDNSGLIRLVPERQFISLDGEYFENPNESNRASLKNIVNVLDVTNDGNIAQVRLQSENDLVSPDNKNTYLLGLNNPGKENVDQVKVVKEENSSPLRFALDNDQIYLVGENKPNLDKTPLKGIVQVINVANPKNGDQIRLVAEDDVSSTDAEIKYSVNRESDKKSQKYTYDENEERYRLPIYLYRFGQNVYLYQPTDQNIPWKQFDISKLLQSAITRRVWDSEQNEEKNSETCLACETLLKILSKNPNILSQFGLLGDENNKNIPTDGILWNYLEGEGKKEPTSLEYHQPSTIITKSGNENNRRMNTENKLVDIYGYNKLEYPQILSPVDVTGNKLDLIMPKPQVNPQYDSKEDNKNFLLTLVAEEPNVRLDKTHLDASKQIGQTLQTQHVSDSKEDSDDASESTQKTPDSPVIYVTPILKTAHEVPLSISDELLTQNVPPQSAVYNLQHNDVPEMLLKLKTPYASKISTAAVSGSEERLMPVVPFALSANSPAAAWNIVPEEDDISNAYTPTPTPWNTVPEEFLPSTPADAIDVSKTYVQFPIAQNGTSQKLLPSEIPDASKLPVSYTSSPHIPKSTSDHLPSSKAPNFSENSTTDFAGTRRSAHNFVKPSTYVQFATDRKYEDTRPKAHTTNTPEKTTDADDVSTAYASLATDRNARPRQLLPLESSDVHERPTTNTILEETTHVPRATDRKYDNNILKEMLPSNAPDANDVSSTQNPLATEKNWSYYDLSNELLPSEAPNTSKTPSTPTTTTTKWKTTPEKMLASKELDAKDEYIKTTQREQKTTMPSKDPHHWNNIPQHSLPTETPDASKSPTTNTPSTSTEEISSSKEADMADKSVTTTRTTTPGEFWSSKTPGTSKTPGQSTTETYHWSNLRKHLQPSSEPVSSELRTAYTLAPTDRTFVEEESEPSKPSDELEIPVGIIYDWDTPEQLPTSPRPDTSEISTANNQMVTDWVTVTEEPVHSVELDAFKIPTTEVPNDRMKTRNGKPEQMLFSEDLDTSKVPTAHTPGPGDWNAYPAESVASVESNIFEIPTSKKPNNWNKPEGILLSADLDTSKVPTVRTSHRTDWNAYPEEPVSSVESNVFEIPTSKIPNDWIKPEEILLSGDLDTSKVPTARTSHPTDWNAYPEESVPSVESNVFEMPTSKIPNDWNKPEEIPSSGDTSKVPTARTSVPTDRNAYPEESVPFVESNVFEIPTSKISNDWNKPEAILSSGDLDTSKVPTSHTSLPTDWISITGESVPSLKTSLPYNRNKPRQLLLSEEPGIFEVPRAYTSVPTDWATVTDELRPPRKPKAFTIPTTRVRDNWYDTPERWRSQRFNAEYGQSMILNFEGTTPEEQYYIRQVMNVLMTDLLRLYYSECHKEANEQLLKRLKVAINSVREENCDTSHSQRYN